MTWMAGLFLFDDPHDLRYYTCASIWTLKAGWDLGSLDNEKLHTCLMGTLARDVMKPWVQLDLQYYLVT